MKLYDISVPVHEGVPTWPGDPPLRITLASSIASGNVANVTRLDMGAHTGTHFDAPFHFHDLQQRMIQEFFNDPVDQGVEVPELVRLHQVGVIARQLKVGIILQEQIGHVVQMDEPVQLGRGQALFAAEIVTQQPR